MKEDFFESKVNEFISQSGMISEGDTVIVGFSGGADSTALLCVLSKLSKSLKLHLVPVHVHHGIRGAEADADAEFCERFCENVGLKLVLRSFDIPALAKSLKKSEEEMGREARYRAFIEEASKYKDAKIAVAHHKDDMAETFLFNLVRGSRLKGLSGIEDEISKEFFTIIRPLLAVDKKEISEYLERNGIKHCEDSTNVENDYSRNKIRNVIIPSLKEINNGCVENILHIADYLGEVEKYLEKQTTVVSMLSEKRTESYFEYDILALKKEEALIYERVIYNGICALAGRRKDITSTHVNLVAGLLFSQSGKMVSLPYGLIAKREFDKLLIVKNEQAKADAYNRIDTDGVEIEITTFPATKDKLENIPKNDYTKWFDFDKIGDVSFEIRKPEAEDFIIVYADGRKKPLTDFFASRKISKRHFDDYDVVAKGNEIIWIPFLRASEGYRVEHDTKIILEMKIKTGNGEKNERQNQSIDFCRRCRKENH